MRALLSAQHFVARYKIFVIIMIVIIKMWQKNTMNHVFVETGENF